MRYAMNSQIFPVSSIQRTRFEASILTQHQPTDTSDASYPILLRARAAIVMTSGTPQLKDKVDSYRQPRVKGQPSLLQMSHFFFLTVLRENTGDGGVNCHIQLTSQERFSFV